MGKITDCDRCNGTGWTGKIPCVDCHTRGVKSSELFDKNLRHYPSKSLIQNC